MELKRIIISEIHEQQIIVLKEVEGERTFSIMIGIFEATSIDRRVKKMPSPRPLTHDLVVNVVEQLGGEISDIYISELRDHTYYAKLRVKNSGELIEVDSRPSDAIAVALRMKAPIYASTQVLAKSKSLPAPVTQTRELQKRLGIQAQDLTLDVATLLDIAFQKGTLVVDVAPGRLAMAAAVVPSARVTACPVAAASLGSRPIPASPSRLLK